MNFRSAARKLLLLLAACLLLASGTSLRAEHSLDLGEYRGKVVLLDFWASWCVPCRRSFPWMNQMQQKYGDSGLVIIGVNMDAEGGAAQTFLDDYPANFKIITDPDGALARQYDVIAMPSSYVIGRDGELVTRHLGFKVKNQGEYESILLESLRTGTE
ncbi:MAG: TlpA disulfide reductase family protein [Proteobacteria bacterium]|nr:TlpA disulfide reductase family protein [Pseudomonadota bacterium]MDA0992009.1 TlpA disulfide reductase family protein [Pseudomonadota bacterium]